MSQDMISLGFDQIIEQLKEQAVSAAARRKLEETAPIMNEGLCRARMEETTAARRVIENAGTPPLTETESFSFISFQHCSFLHHCVVLIPAHVSVR